MKKLIVERNRYFDSVFLMRISAELEKLEGIEQAVVAMGDEFAHRADGQPSLQSLGTIRYARKRL